jgi:hypothetical protein
MAVDDLRLRHQMPYEFVMRHSSRRTIASGWMATMRGLRKVSRALAIIILAALSCGLVVNAVVDGPVEYQLPIAAVLALSAVGLTATWFWSPF